MSAHYVLVDDIVLETRSNIQFVTKPTINHKNSTTQYFII